MSSIQIINQQFKFSFDTFVRCFKTILNCTAVEQVATIKQAALKYKSAGRDTDRINGKRRFRND